MDSRWGSRAPGWAQRQPPASPSEDGWLLGFDVGATKLAVVAGSTNGTVHAESVAATPHERTFESMWPVMCDLADQHIAQYGPPRSIGVSIGGPVDASTGVVYSPANLNGWLETPLRDRLADRFSRPVHVEHDAKAGALAEWFFGAGRGLSNLIFLTFGTGLGAGFIVDGRLCRGRNNNAGEVGHWRMAADGPLAYGKPGSFEAFASGAGLERLASYRYPEHSQRFGRPVDIVDAARSGDSEAIAIIDESATVLGQGVAFLVDLLAPDVVILGSLAVRAGDLYLPRVQAVVDKECIDRTLPCPVVAAGCGMKIGSLAAISAAVYGDRQHV